MNISTEPMPPPSEYEAAMAAYDAVKVAVTEILTAHVSLVVDGAYTTLTDTGQRDGLQVMNALETIGLLLIDYAVKNTGGDPAPLKAEILNPDAPWSYEVDPATVEFIATLATLGAAEAEKLDFREETDPMPVLLVMTALAVRAVGGERWGEVFDGFADAVTTDLRLGPYERRIRERAEKVGRRRLVDNLTALCDAGVAVDVERLAALCRVLRDEAARDEDFKHAWEHFTGYMVVVLMRATIGGEPGTFAPSPDQVDQLAAAPFEPDGAWHAQPSLEPDVRECLRAANGMPSLSGGGPLGLEPLIGILFADHTYRHGRDWHEDLERLMFQYRHHFGI